MAGSFTDFTEKAVLDNLFGQNTTSISTGRFGNLRFGLWRSTAANLNDALKSTSTGECAGSTYIRESVANTTALWCNTTLGTGIKKLKAAVVLTTAAGSDWGTIGGFAIFNTTKGASGNCLVYSTLTGGNKVINTGDSVTITTALTITLG
jgi:hypothetical protein